MLKAASFTGLLIWDAAAAFCLQHYESFLIKARAARHLKAHESLHLKARAGRLPRNASN